VRRDIYVALITTNQYHRGVELLHNYRARLWASVCDTYSHPPRF